MKYLWIVVLFLSQAAWAQRKAAEDCRQDIGLSIGIYGPLRVHPGAETVYGIRYGRFWPGGLGLRTGLQYMPENVEIEHTVGVPVAVAFRSGLRGFGESVQSGLGAAADSWDDYYYGYPDAPFRDAWSAFLLNLFSRFEAFAGLTPGGIFGDSRIHQVWDSSEPDGEFHEEGVLKRSSFCLSADLGFTLSYRIWRFCLNLTPAIHYYITDNYRDYARFHTRAAASQNRSDPIRWQMSVCFGLSYLF